MPKSRRDGAKVARPTKSLDATLWEAADKLRGNLEAAEYKHVLLGLVFLKYVSDSFEQRRRFLEKATADPDSEFYVPAHSAREAIVESRDEYLSENVFWVPREARWSELQAKAKLPEIGRLIDSAMDAIEKENPSLRGVLPKAYARAEIDKRLLGELVDLIGSIGFTEIDHGSDDILGRVYEYCLGKFAAAEGRNAGEFYTPRPIVRLLVEMLEPFKGRVFDPCCGSGGMFVQSAEFVKAHGGKRDDIAIYGQEFVASTWRLAKMNLAIRGIEANLADEAADSFHNDKFPDLRADFILANPPFNKDDWGQPLLRDDRRWAGGAPPATNANFAWVQHFVYHLAPAGVAGFVLANIALSSLKNGEGDIRRHLVNSDLVDCVVSLPEKLFFNTGIAVSLWFLAKGRKSHDRRTGRTLFIDASSAGRMLSRKLRTLDPDDITRIASTYRSWRTGNGYADEIAFCRQATTDEIAANNFILTPGRYVRSAELEIPRVTDEEMGELLADLGQQFDRSAQLSQAVLERLSAVVG